MAHIDLEILDIALSGSSSGAYALVLGEVKGKRKLPIVIGGQKRSPSPSRWRTCVRAGL